VVSIYSQCNLKSNCKQPANTCHGWYMLQILNHGWLNSLSSLYKSQPLATSLRFLLPLGQGFVHMSVCYK